MSRNPEQSGAAKSLLDDIGDSSPIGSEGHYLEHLCKILAVNRLKYKCRNFLQIQIAAVQGNFFWKKLVYGTDHNTQGDKHE
jgi:hypothetical protein